MPIAVIAQSLEMRANAAFQTHTRAHELSGFLLRQDRKAIEAALGKPFREGKNSSGANWHAYHLPGFKGNYLVAIYVEDTKSFWNGKVVQLELTGDEPSGPTGFFGLQLGDSAEKVEMVLGKPTKISHEDDVNVDLWNYAHMNYSLEFTAAQKLYSIHVDEEPDDLKPEVGGASEVYAFAKAVKAHNMDREVSLASGEIVCTKKEFFGIQGGQARKILDDETSAISICLAQAADAILALGPEMKATDTAVRVWEKGPPGMVVKFPKNSPMREVVLMDEAGSPRIYEVTFR
jgi:hypothetical protein